MNKSVSIPYKCQCMNEEAVVLVPFRRKDENVIQWMDACVGPALSLDHRFRSPDCRSTKMEYAKIPLPENAPYLGAKPEMN